MNAETPGIRLDKWLWQARFFKTRTLAGKVVSSGAVRVNSQRTSKPATKIKVGDGLTFIQAERIRIVEVLALGERRGPAPEAQLLYSDLSPHPERKDVVRSTPQSERKGRPTKKERRQTDELRRNGP